ncbi:Rod shape-determining protein MreD [Mucinivorans hirudinis]|uniref:Rod shape-determining protein MreD n=1 Tax=Mucinivorans hirudinis TaxID=1433126 RepID=A0A060RC06_9BACT|nr:Rod shape-determining protein MreD [Mucinivorans hirudinis]
MLQIVEYIISFIVLILTQVFIFDNVNIFGMVTPYIYIMFIIVLPMQIGHTLLIILGFVSGGVVDLLTGSGGLSAMVATWVAFIRPALLHITAGRDIVSEGGIPSVVRMGGAKFIFYLSMMVFAYNIPLFILETMNIKYIAVTSLRILFSSVFSIITIYLAHYLMLMRRK